MAKQLEYLIGMVARAGSGRGLSGFSPKDDQAGRVMLSHHQEREHGREGAPVIELVRITSAKIHGGACIQKQMAADVSIVLELLYVILIGSSPDLPVHVSKIIPFDVGTISGELG